jgi:hypothetical protein
MRYCPFCHRWNLDRPQLCNYCGRSWYVRLCPRGHENPADAQFCGTCGSADLTDTAGPRPLWLRLLRAGFLLIIILMVILIVHGFPSIPDLLTSLSPFIIAIVFLVIAYYLCLSIVPGPLKRPLLAFNKKIMSVVLRFLGWCWERIKLTFS